MKNIITSIIFFLQRLFRGYSDVDIWGLNTHLARFLSARMKAFKKMNANSYPSSLKSHEEWHEIIDKIIWSFENYDKDDHCFVENPGYIENVSNMLICDHDALNEHWRKTQEGIDLFAKYFSNLWD